ncbi:MAG: inorganic phosphate transporter, partial [Acidobacteriota bacterium]
QQALNGAHVFSAGAVSFARGLNDTPKIVALLVAGRILGLRGSLLMVGLAMAAGALLQARKVATTMSAGITAMNHGQGATANLVTAGLVIVASRFGLPVSTTHVTCGSLFGLGAVTGQARTDTIRRIIMAWVLTLPLAASLAAGGAVLL